MFDHDLVLKANELFLVGRSEDTDGITEAGLYLRDTRFLDRFRLAIDGASMCVLSVNTSDGRCATINLANHASHRLDAARHTIGIEQRIELDQTLRVTLKIQNFGQSPISFTMALEMAADFRDMFEVRGWDAKRHGTLQPADLYNDSICLSIVGPGDLVETSTITLDPPPTGVTPGKPGEATAVYEVALDPAEAQQFVIVCTPDSADNRPVGGIAVTETGPGFAFWSNNAELQQLIDRGDSDLLLLQTTFPDGTMPAAGIPWFVAPFGRDSLIVSLQTMHAYPQRIASTLRVLAALQGAKVDEFTEEQPGKILHEVRYGELARTGQIPQTPYYGSIDSTPLFVMTFAQHYLWHRDETVWDDLIDTVRRALTWIETYGDLDGDGLIEFKGTAPDHAHIAQQGWKDSWDSLNHPDGSPVTGPIALVEVQGYVYAAYATLSEAAALHGDAAWSRELRQHAKRVRRVVEDSFWLEDEGFYAQALDGKKQPVAAISSNPGHLLFCELPSPERAERVVDRMMQPDLYGGWGIRTLGSSMATYNPMSYHNGSIWPHDTSLAMTGFRHYGQDAAAIQLAIGLVALGYFTPESRLAELYCGYEIDGHEDGPVDYPVSCKPQAWAAGSVHLVVRTLLGLKPDFKNKRMVVDPFLPPQFEAISAAGLAAFGKRFDLGVQVQDEHYEVMPLGDVEIVVAVGD